MNKTKKLKIIIGLFYLIVVLIFLYELFSRFSIDEVTSYKFIQFNREFFANLKESNLIILSIVFLGMVIVWVFMLGFGSPVALIAGFIFGSYLGTFLVVLGCTMGATTLYIFANYFLKDFVKKTFLTRFKKLEGKFKKSEFNYLVLYRLIGAIPFAVANIMPCIFNVSIKNFFWSTFFGIMPALFVICSLGSGIETIIEKSEKAPKILDLLYSQEIYIPLVGFFFIFIFTIILKKIFFK